MHTEMENYLLSKKILRQKAFAKKIIGTSHSAA